ncbi:DEKNAAC101770 [Brettanomyces naardenensis]|uniref:60S ribosomal subunit assembly/export protein LOC1 n=1 Tax=Brettanomyces naardenensis TaxID=13370 RepID=A0A448YIM4_BRENA|nr:DEKNAAC101770 [Brettanomyces naardenensis]
MDQPKLTPKSTKRILQGKALKKHLRTTQLYGKKSKQRQYTEKELDIPILNASVNPGAIKKRGKKGKKFIPDGDDLTLNRLIRQINDDKDKISESKLEKSRRLEEIRELRRMEMERKEQKKTDELNSVKIELKSKASLARSARRKNAKQRRNTELEDDDDNDKKKKKKKSVSFA